MILERIKNGFYTRIFKFFYRSKFKMFGNKSHIFFPLKLNGLENISIGDNVHIAYKTWLAALPLTGDVNCNLHIMDGCQIGNFNHIYATKSIIIGKNVLTADRVYISDNLHSYEDIELPILKQPIKQIGNVEIGEGSWLGENVCVLGSKIGKHCVIGANSVVTKDIPDYSIAAGIPAKIIKKYCFNQNEWVKVNA